MTSSTTPQDRAVELSPEVDRAIDVIRELTGRKDERDEEVIHLLADAGLLSSGTQKGEGSLRSNASSDVPTESDIELVAERLRDFRLRLGPNTMDRIRNGADSIPLSGGERHEVAHAALLAVKALEGA